jgi:anaerobic sulfite reductase subunit B
MPESKLAPPPTGVSDLGEPFVPALHHVTARRRITPDVVTLLLRPTEGDLRPFRAGQFNMVTALGVGEVPVSMSGAPGDDDLAHTIRDVGAVTHALCEADVGDVVGLRGPFGTDWGIDRLGDDTDVLVVAGGIGLAPVRGAIEQLLARRAGAGGGAGRIAVLVGARDPSQVVFADDLERWRRGGAQVEVTVDVSDSVWGGHVGVVTSLVPLVELEPLRTTALVCGPEVMIRFTARDLVDRGLPAGSIRVSLERNMQCGFGVCGHCQLGPLLLCRDGPVVEYDPVVGGLLTERER